MYSLANEYSQLLERKQEIETALGSCAKGYISEKTINGKRYSYLQTKIKGKLTSTYLKTEEVDKVQSQLTQRREYEEELPGIDLRIKELEQAANLIGKGIDRALMLLKISTGMDQLEQEQKAKCISFANSMNAVEGVPVSEQTAAEIALWQNGQKSFQAVFSATLKRYGFTVEV